MADIADVIGELRTIAVGVSPKTGFDQINSFFYDREFVMNDERDKKYKALLVQSDVTQTITERNSAFLPKKKMYTLNLHLFDTYKEGEKGSTDLEVKQAELDLVMDQYLAKVQQRIVDDTPANKGWKIVGQQTGIFNRDQHNDKLIQVSRTLTIEIFTTCDTGTFDL